ncbi:MAG: phosphoribosylformylglycinamidine cyclo-ligase [Desulforegulaceae bacterium]|nr:phosphoribosylformylglycinamidine cyclo-ligase [Desulforegulaceae bacterium]
MTEKGLTYADAGVDIDKANRFVKKIKDLVAKTPRTGVMGNIGGFGGLYSPNLSNMKSPVLVSSTDGVGTKLKIAQMSNIHNTIGIDLVAMCVNDIIVQGAKPLFFLDYLATGKLDEDVAVSIVEGISNGCIEAECSLIGGETAEMPGLYKEGDYDLAGFSVGIVDDHKIVDGSGIRVGHKIIGIASSGIHSNGYSLVRKVCFDHLKLKLDDYVEDLGCTLCEELIKPTRIYVKTIMSLLREINVYGLSHITGGGFEDNISRILPSACKAVLDKDSWERQPIFHFLQQAGKIDEMEMLKTFNCGIGMALIADETSAQDIVHRLSAENDKAFIIGEIFNRDNDEAQVQWKK